MQLDDRQQRLAYIGAVVAAVGFFAVQAPDFPTSIPYTFVGLAMAAFLAFAAYRRSVVLTGAGAFIVSFGPWGTVWFFGAVYIACGGLLMFRASKEAAEKAGPRQTRRKKEKAQPTAAPAKKQPGRSKRYTPPTTRSKRSGGT